MAGNSVPAFFGAKARTIKPVALDITFATDQSGSMRQFVAFLNSLETFTSLETALIAQGVGVTQNNRYSVCSGAGGVDSPLGAHDELSEIEYQIVVNGISQRWATGSSFLAGQAVLPVLSATAGNDTEDMGLAAHLIAGGAREYSEDSLRILVSAGDLQCPYLEDVVDNSVALATLTDPATAQRYVGVHAVNITYTEPASPNPIPSGSPFGFVYSSNTTGTAIYLNGNTLNYREEVTVSAVSLAFAGFTGPGYAPDPGQADEILDFARQTNGAIYSLSSFNAAAFGTSLGEVLGGYLYATEA